jgi:DNA-binding CsgD family transcriptional regulator
MKLSGGCAEGAGGPLLRVSDWRGAAGPPRLFRPGLEKELHSLRAALSLEEFWRATIRVLNAALPNLFVAVCLQDIPLSDPGERQVIELLRQGATNAEIAERLQLSLSKVKKMLSRIFRKLGVSSRARLMALARTGASAKQTAECCANGGKGKTNDR